MTDHESQLYQIQSLIDQLPAVNYTTLKRVIGHLSRITDLEEKNKMGLSNIVKIFGPTLMTVDGDTVSGWDVGCGGVRVLGCEWEKCRGVSGRSVGWKWEECRGGSGRSVGL